VRNAEGRDLGSLTLRDAAQGITVSGRLTGLPPGAHAIHLHVTGQCAPPFESAGGHWNPTNAQHGTQNAQGPHFGDLPNITVAADSSVTVDATTPGGTLRGTNPLIDVDGAAVVVHTSADDNRTDPAGSSGARIACGVVSGS
jgi:Cu-Zn family superoxide dismutase